MIDVDNWLCCDDQILLVPVTDVHDLNFRDKHIKRKNSQSTQAPIKYAWVHWVHDAIDQDKISKKKFCQTYF